MSHSQRSEVIGAHGQWLANVHLGQGVWAHGHPETVASQRMLKIIQAVADFGLEDYQGLTVLDLGTQEGVHALEFARRGAIVTAIEGRLLNFMKLKLAKDGNRFDNLTVLQADVRDLNFVEIGKFDVIICSGILYHLPKRTQANLLLGMARNCKSLLIIDTHVGLQRSSSFEQEGQMYYGDEATEYNPDQTNDDFELSLGSSIDNEPSFQISRESLVNLMVKSGFSSVYESFVPVRSSTNERALVNRCNFVAFKGKPARHNNVSFPIERYAEGELSFYSPRDAMLMERLKRSWIYNVVRVYLRLWRSLT